MMLRTITPRLSESLYYNLKYLLAGSSRFRSMNHFVCEAIREKLTQVARERPESREAYQGILRALNDDVLIVGSELLCEGRDQTETITADSAPLTVEPASSAASS